MSTDTTITGKPSAAPRLLGQMRAAIRVRHYSLRTEQIYMQRARRYILFHNKRHPNSMGAGEVRAFLSYLATERDVSAATQNQAKAALLFLYRQVLNVDLPWLDEVVTAKPSRHLPTVLTPREVQALLQEMSGVTGLVASLLYGAGRRCIRPMWLAVAARWSYPMHWL